MSTSMLERFRAPKDLELRDKDAGDTPLRDDKKGKLKNGEIKERERALTAELTAEVAKLQEKLYAARDQKLLLILQGMDTSGKDGTIRALFSQINPMGLHATGFVAPTDKEKAHDFLWRVHARVPARGEIGIFNRSHYEDVLVPRLSGDLDDDARERRCAQIRDFERMLAGTGTTIVKVFLHISKTEQRARLQARLDDPEKHWKFDPADLAARTKWDDYQRAYADMINATDRDHAPWYVVPADSKTHRNLIIAHLLLETMRGMKLAWPAPKADMSKVKIDD
ncbi:PPK2 family polyphosphate kinase [Massilia luteola]|jgi:PPK2 family polyphosphate:nucleotide phosphotransferase|uniref:PPK2 family polyphosphate kinase n=1 Tax=Massilia luteola TaxID=3081751 RepID=UPI002ACC21FB|nr:PPK2 family polyphosphate kinase [Massilia sp. Gc5]